MKLEFEVWGRVGRPLNRVFRAVRNPRELSSYFATGGASALLETGKTVTWDFADFPGEFPVEVKRVVKNRSILISWNSATGGNNDVLFNNEDEPCHKSGRKCLPGEKLKMINLRSQRQPAASLDSEAEGSQFR